MALVYVPDVRLPPNLTNGVMTYPNATIAPITIPQHNNYNATLENERVCMQLKAPTMSIGVFDKSRYIKIRNVKRRKENVYIKLMLVSNGDLFVYYTESGKQEVTSEEIQRNGQFVCFLRSFDVISLLARLLPG